MCDIIDLSENQPAIAVYEENFNVFHILNLTDIRRLANGSMAISEFSDPEGVSRAMAIALIERL